MLLRRWSNVNSMKNGIGQGTKGNRVKLLHGDAFDVLAKLDAGSVDLFVCSPPYFIGKEYDRSSRIDGFERDHERLLPLLTRALNDGGSICWQVGNHVANGAIIPLDAVVYQIFRREPKLLLRNRIVWTFGHGAHASKRFSGRHETLLWFTKGATYHFELDAVRVPQKYPGKKHYKGPRKGDWSGNPAGKNPSDVWDIPNVKAGHIEKTEHPCQFPVALVQRCIRSMVPAGGLVVDPFMGVGSAAVASVLEGRRFVGCDIEARYVAIANKRVAAALSGKETHRPDVPVQKPPSGQAVTLRPPHFSAIDVV